MMFFIVCILIVQNEFIEIKSELILNSAQYQTDCSDGLRNGIDVFSLAGSVGPDFNILVNNAAWQSTVYVTIQRNGSGSFNDLCPVPIGVNGSLCNAVSTQACYCFNFDVTKQTAYFLVNYTARAFNSNATIHTEWQNTNATVIYSNSQTISRIYDLPKLELTIQSNKINNAHISENQIIEVAHNDNVSLEFTCSETASPCDVNIFLNGTLTSGIKSVRVSFIFNMTGSEKLNITTEYVVCSKKLSKRHLTFFIEAEVKKTDDKLALILGLAIGLGLGILLLIGFVVLIYCLWKKNKNPASGNIQKRGSSHSRDNSVSPAQLKLNVTNDSARSIENKSH